MKSHRERFELLINRFIEVVVDVCINVLLPLKALEQKYSTIFKLVLVVNKSFSIVNKFLLGLNIFSQQSYLRNNFTFSEMKPTQNHILKFFLVMVLLVFQLRDSLYENNEIISIRYQ